jgi:hypothetical protein
MSTLADERPQADFRLINELIRGSFLYTVSLPLGADILPYLGGVLEISFCDKAHNSLHRLGLSQ